jgi:hypothetical protein
MASLAAASATSSSDPTDPPISHAFATTFRDAALAAGWYTANSRAGKKKAAASDLQAFEKHISGVVSLCSVGSPFIHKVR